MDSKIDPHFEVPRPALPKTKDAVAPSGLSFRFWNLNWKEHLPRPIQSGEAVVDLVPWTQARTFLTENISNLYSKTDLESPFLFLEQHPSKDVFYREVADTFLVFDSPKRAQILGAFMGNPSDWSTYYLRFSAFLPEVRGRGLFTGVLTNLLDILAKFPIERVEGDITPTNIPHIMRLSKFGFVTTGTFMSERWGSLVRMTKFLTQKTDSVFSKQYCFGTYEKPIERRISK